MVEWLWIRRSYSGGSIHGKPQARSHTEIDNMSEDEAWHWLRSNALVQLQEDDEIQNGADS